MKLKPILASLMLLGLAAPAFADAPATASASTQSQIDSMKAQLNKMEAIVNQNSAGGFQQAADWTSRITVSGILDVNGAISNDTPNFGLATSATGNGRSSNISVNNANLFVDALVNDWTNVHIGLAYDSNATSTFSYQPATPTFDEAYVTLANFSESPFFMRAGREYLPFGVYNRFPIVMNPTQLLSETSGDAAQVGFVSPVGIYGSAYGFNGIYENNTPTNRPRVNAWGANLGYAYSDAMYGMKLDAGYISNMNNVNYLADAPLNSNFGYANRIGGVALSADANMGPFDAGLRYVTALQSSKSAVILNTASQTVDYAKPAALGAELGYSFPVLAHQSRAALGYQHTYNSSSNNQLGVGSFAAVGSYGLPLNRYYANYTVNVSKWTDVGLEVYHDKDYSQTMFGTGKSATVGVLQLGVKFA